MKGRVSVVITTYYRNETLRDAIESALAQSYEPVEVVVVDDSGERHAEAVAEEYDVSYAAHERNRGQVAGWQTGLDVSDGQYVQLLDDDDWLDERKVATHVDVLERNPDAGVAYGGLAFADGSVARPTPDLQGEVLEQALALLMPPCTTSSLLVERAVLEDVAPFPDYEAATDIPLKIELARRTEFAAVDELLVFRGDSSDSKGESIAAAEARWRILEEYEELYESRPETVYRRALATTLRFEGMVHWQTHGWSPLAIRNFARVLRVAPDRQFTDVAALGLSILGGPGHAVGRRLMSLIKSRRTETVDVHEQPHGPSTHTEFRISDGRQA